MTTKLTRDIFQTAEGRRRAWRDLMLGDHGALRKLYDNSHEIAPGKMWRSYQPSPAGLKKWRDRGIKTVVNLRGDKPSGHFFLEDEACKALGLRHVPFRVFSRDAPSKEILHGARTLFRKIEYPAMMHCKSGADRVGLMSTLYLFFEEGASLEKAREQLSFKYGHIRQGKTGVIDFAFDQYAAHAASLGKSLSSVDDFFDWVDNHYNPTATKADFRSKSWGDFLTEAVLRRE